MGRCVYEYGDGRQCSYRGDLDDGDMCPRHGREVDERMDAMGRREDCNRFLEPMVNGRVGDFPDHTAPWGCGRSGCIVCDHKPSYHKYMSERIGV